MKLIIDIPNEQYEYIKQSDKNTFAEVSSKECMLYAIKTGVPCDTPGDLISRSALKEVLKENEWITDTNSGGLEDIIDDAPAVSISQGEWANGFHEGFNAGNRLAEIFNERSQEDWIPVSEELPPNYILCLFCTSDGDIFYGYRNSENLWHEKGSTENISNVVAWQELPKPCKRGEE